MKMVKFYTPYKTELPIHSDIILDKYYEIVNETYTHFTIFDEANDYQEFCKEGCNGYNLDYIFSE